MWKSMRKSMQESMRKIMLKSMLKSMQKSMWKSMRKSICTKNVTRMAHVKKGLKIKSAKIANAGGGEEEGGEGEEFQVELDFPWREVKIT